MAHTGCPHTLPLVGGELLVYVFLPAVIAVIGGLLIRGQGATRGARFWIGMALLIAGAAVFLWVQLLIML